MTSRGASFPALDQSSATYTAGQSNYQAGVVMQWTGEGGTIGKTRPQFKKIEMVNHKLAGIIPATMELIEDNNAALESILIQLFGEAIAFQEDYSFINGDGVAKPLGFLNANACITTATALTAAAPTMPQINTMSKRLWAQGQQRAVWIANTLLSDAIKNIVQDSGNGLTYMPNLNSTSQMVDGLVPMLDGKKVLLSEKMPATFADGGLALVDLQHYAVGTRQTIEVSYSEHIFFDTAELAWRAISRVDGQPRITGPVKIGSAAAATVSPFVKSQ
jgi:HK97 family phage major capsid protein